MNEKHWYKKWWGVMLLVFLFLGLTFIATFGFFVFNLAKKIQYDEARVQNLKLKNFVGDKQKTAEGDGSNYWIGSANPKVTIVEFSDFSCPYCHAAFPKIREISLKYPKDVKIIYRDFPIKQDYSTDLALAGRCAGEQGLFWLMHDKLFQNQGVSQQNQLTELANQIGADVPKFENCMTSKKYLPQIRKDFSDADLLEAKGTPTWFINGYKIEGDMPYNIFEEIINRFIKS